MRHNILLVDDEPGIRKVLRISLEEMGYRVHTAENGEQALRLFRENQPLIVLTDIKMPGMDGIDVLRKIKQENPETEVIVITGHGDMDLAIRSLKNEATDFITKPIDDKELQNALQKSENNLTIRQKLREYTENLESMVQQKSQRLSSVLESQEQAQSLGAYQELFDEIPGYVIVLDREYRIQAANKGFKRDFPWDEPEGDTEQGGDPGRCYQLLKQKDFQCPDCPVAKTFETGEAHQSELEYTDREGEKRKLMGWTSPIKDRSGAVDQVMVMSTDISRIMDLKDHLSSLGLMVGSVSHGIKGLLTGLDGGVYMLDSGLSKDDPRRITEGLDLVKLMAGKIKNMVLDILFYTKERELDFGDLDIYRFAGNLAKTVRDRAKQQGILFEADIPETLQGQTWRIDGEQLQVALVNILENALDACAEDGGKPTHAVWLSVHVEADELVFTIRDNGTGMDAETQEKIFTLFFSSKASRGTGMGLFITQKIISQHGGRIAVDSQPGMGTRFTVRIPKG